MAELRDVVAYLAAHYPYKQDLSKSRLTKMVYLADWRSVIQRGHQLTPVQWRYNYYGPYVEDVTDVARRDPAFEVIQTSNRFGDPKELIQIQQPTEYSTLSPDDRKVLDFVIESTSSLNWTEFVKLVYSTYPIVTQPRFSDLDLVAIAQRYRRDQQVFGWNGETPTGEAPDRAATGAMPGPSPVASRPAE
jgi:hypothetical protein